MKEIDQLIREQKIKENNLYCLIVKYVQDNQLEEAFCEDCSSYLDPDDGDCITGSDFNDESIYLLFIDEWKVLRMVEFFKKINLFVKCEKVSDVLYFLKSDVKYLEHYINSEENKNILDDYILSHVTADNILDMMNENKNKGFSLLPIEIKILSAS